MRLLLITAIFFYISATQAFTPKEHATCSRRWVKVGCYRDSLSPRPLPFELLNDRDVTSKNNDGYLLDWYKWGESIHSLACRCAEKARAKGYKMFGLQFYGECWSGPMSQLKFNKDGPSDNCYQQLTKPYGCVKSDPLSECVGGEATNYIYMLTENTPEPQSPDIDGGYSKWSEWSVCSATCGVGTTSRERTCNNPTPKGNGKPCNPRHGYPVQTEKCHLADCPAKCKKALDVGIVVDSSASVRRENFAKVKTFLEELVKKLEVGAALTHVGMIRYSHYANTLWDFNGDVNHNLQKLLAAIENIQFRPGGTRTDLALEKANTELFSAKGGQRSSVPHVLLVVTDGKTASNSKAYSQVLKPLQAKGIKLVSIGVGHSIGMEELKVIALQHNQNVFKLDSFDDLVKRLSKIMHSFCMTRF